MNIYLKFVAITILFGLAACSSEDISKYDKGYEAAWDGESVSCSLWTSNEEKKGYEEGIEKAGM